VRRRQRRHVSKRRRRQRWIESIVLFIPAIVPAAGTASPTDELLRAESSRDDRRCGT
jgi:hypothetical protein